MHTLSPTRIDAHSVRKAPLGFEFWGLTVLAEWCALQAGRPFLHAASDATRAAHRVALLLAA